MDHRRKATLVAAAAGLALACAIGSGCQSGTMVWIEKSVPYPFAPASIRIHPLTKLDRDESGEVILVCHIELLDAWGESVRGVGNLRISLFGPARPVPIEDAAWSFNLNDLPTNATLYDSATRTYRLQLGELPAWAVEMGSGEGTSASGSILAQLTMIGLDDQEIVVEGRSTLRR